jgi:acyl-CoA reductase-like NAD-dependent aldehyde dehydrogenase
MTPDAARTATLVRALHASIEHNRSAAGDVYTEDVRAWTPAMSTASLSELMDEFERRDDAFSEMRMTLHGITVAEFRGDRICSIRQH